MTTMASSTAPAEQELQHPGTASRSGAAVRALAAVDWTPAPSVRRCDCGHACKHGSRCPSCGMRRRHIARRPAVTGRSSLTRWTETYLCDYCETLVEATVDRPDLPWGEHLGPQAVQVFDGVAQPGQFDDDVHFADTALANEPVPGGVQIPKAPQPMPPFPPTTWGLP